MWYLPRINAWKIKARYSVKSVLWALTLAPCLFPVLGETSSAQDSQRIAAIVNDEIISRFDLASRINLIILSSQLPKTPEVIGRISSQVLRGLIDDKLRLQEARRLHITLSENEYAGAISNLEKSNRMKPGGMYALLNENGIDRTSFRTQLEAALVWQKIVRRQINATVKISEQAIKEALKRINQHKGKPEYLVSEIFIPFETGKEVAEVQKLALRLRRQIDEGGNFEALARAFSQSATAAKGGSLGWIREDQLDPELSNVVVKQTPGAVSEPIQGADGYYILTLHNQRISAGLAQPDISVDLQQVFFDLKIGATEAEIDAQFKFAASASKPAKNCADLGRLGEKLGAPRSGKLNDIKLTSLPANLRKIVSTSKLNVASDPIKIGGGVVVLMVCGRKGELAEEQASHQVEIMLIEQQAQLIARRLLRDLQRAAFVDIRQ